MEDLISDLLILSSLDSVLHAPRLESSGGFKQEGSISSEIRPGIEAIQPFSPNEEVEYEKIWEYEEQLDDGLLSCVLIIESPESRGPKLGRGGAPGNGQSECYAFVEDNYEYGSRCQ